MVEVVAERVVEGRAVEGRQEDTPAVVQATGIAAGRVEVWEGVLFCGPIGPWTV